MKKLNIAIIGLGNIGSYLYKYLKSNKIEKSFIDPDSSKLTNVQLEKTLHGAQLKSYNFTIYFFV